jgi:predicted PurR-regulated permease PerM
MVEVMKASPIGPSQWYWRIWFGLLTCGLAFWIIVTHSSLVLEIALVLFAAFLLSVGLSPITDAAASRAIPRGLTVLIVYILLAVSIVLLTGMLVPVIRSEIALLQTNGPTLFQEALSHVQGTPVARFLPSTNTLAAGLSQHLDSLLTALFGAVTGIGEGALDLLIVLILAYFFSTDAELGGRVLNAWFPDRYQFRASLIFARVRHRLARWMLAQFAVALYFAGVFSLGLSLLGVPFAITIGLVGGVLELVPYLGGAVALLLATVSALTIQPLLAVWVVLFYAVVVEVEGHIVAPALYGRVTGLHPAVVLIALLIGAKTVGLLGVLFSVPVAVVLMSFLRELRTVWTGADAGAPT